MTGFHHRLPLERIRATRMPVRLEAGPAAREEVRERFDLVALERLEADLEIWRVPGGAEVEGRMVADAVLRCVVSGEPVPVHVEEPVRLRFLPAVDTVEEIELSPEDLDVMGIEEGAVDLGEAIVQTLALALPQYPRRDDVVVPGLLSEAEADALTRDNQGRSNPFSVLRGH